MKKELEDHRHLESLALEILKSVKLRSAVVDMTVDADFDFEEDWFLDEVRKLGLVGKKKLKVKVKDELNFGDTEMRIEFVESFEGLKLREDRLNALLLVLSRKVGRAKKGNVSNFGRSEGEDKCLSELPPKEIKFWYVNLEKGEFVKSSHMR